MRNRLTTKGDNDPGVELMLKMLGDFVVADLSTEINIVRKLARHSFESPFGTATDESSNSENVVKQIKCKGRIFILHFCIALTFCWI